MARLASLGSTAVFRRALFPQGFAGEVMTHVLDTWAQFNLNRQVRYETRISALFRDALIQAYVDAGRAWFIVLEDPITDAEFGTEIGRNDLRFYPANHYGQSVFFTVECKRLRVQVGNGTRSLADEYVAEGVQRFVNGRYSSGLPCGGILGYVMDNQLDLAFAAVEMAVNDKRDNLRLSAGGFQSPSIVLRDYQWSADTQHARDDGQFTVHHVLLGVQQ